MRKFIIISCLLLIGITPEVNSLNWVQKPAMPSFNRDRAVGFTINDAIYVGAGNFNFIGQTDFWKFDTQTLTWTQISDIANPRHGATGFSYNGKGYVAWGANFSPVMFYGD